jgi:hypothetical protein
MVVAVALTFYAGLAFAVARLLSLNSRWERAVSTLGDRHGELAPAMAMAAPPSTVREARPRMEAPVTAKTAIIAAPAPEPVAEEQEEERELVEVGF